MGCSVINLPVVKIDPSNMVIGETPTPSSLACDNLHYETNKIFAPSTLVVNLDGRALLRDVDYIIDSDNQGFTLVIDENDPNRLNKPQQNDEEITVNYFVAVHANCEAINC